MSELPIWPDEVPNPQIRAHARQIADAARVLFRTFPQSNCVPSFLLEATLAIELYLKSLNASTERHKQDGFYGHLLTARYAGGKSHSLTGIYNSIDQELRSELQQAYSTSTMIAGRFEFADTLAPFDTLFVEIRYVFERQQSVSHNITDLMRILDFLSNIIDRMNVRARTPAGLARIIRHLPPDSTASE